MENQKGMKEKSGLIAIGISIIIGLFILGYYLNSSVKTFKDYERTVTVRGLAEQEHLVDVVIWPIQFTEASNNQEEIYRLLDESSSKVVEFLKNNGITDDEISIDVPVVTDRSAQRWGGETGGAIQVCGISIGNGLFQ